jgi:hypothetical protein
MKIAVVTTFHEAGLKKYAQKMIDTFCKNWPKEIVLHIYPEKCNPKIIDHDHVTLTDLDSVNELITFKEKWKNVPKANGDVSDDPVRRLRKDAGKGFKWDAVRFAHKVYAIKKQLEKNASDYLIWLDSDVVTIKNIQINFLNSLINDHNYLSYLGRDHINFHSECGF